MRKGATKVEQVMATEDGDGKFTYRRGYESNTENSTKKCKRGGDCANGQQEIDDTDNTKSTTPAPAGDDLPYGDPAHQGGSGSGSGSGEPHPAPAPEGHTPTPIEEPFDIHI